MDTKPQQSFFKRFWWLFLLILIIIAVVLIFIFYQPKQDEVADNINMKKSVSSEQNINISSVEKNIDTTDWLTYRNEVAKFELKYPPENWEIETVVGEEPSTTMTPTFRYCGYMTGSSFLGFYAYDYEVEENTELESLFVVLDLEEIIEQKITTLENEQALQTKFRRQNNDTLEEFIDVIHNSRVYRLFLGQEPEETCENDPERTATYREIQDKILSTFKFID